MPEFPFLEVTRFDALTLVHLHNSDKISFQLEGRTLAVLLGTELHLFELENGSAQFRSLKVILEVKWFQFVGSKLLICDLLGRWSIYDAAMDWGLAASTIFKDELSPQETVSSMIVSESGNYVYLRMQLAEGYLFDLSSGKCMAILAREDARGHCSFTKTPDGRELLFISSPSYLDISVYDCASGQLISSGLGSSAWDFCHVQYKLSQDARRLITFGCVWADEYVNRIYKTDHCPWLWDAEKLPAQMPVPLQLELEYSQRFSLPYLELYLSIATMDADATHCDFVSIVDLEALPQPGSEEDDELQENIVPIDAVILDALRKLGQQFPCAIVSRTIRITDGEVIHFHCWGCLKVAEANVHLLAQNQILVVTEEVLLLDGKTGSKTVLGKAPFLAGKAGWMTTACSQSADIVVVKPYK